MVSGRGTGGWRVGRVFVVSCEHAGNKVPKRHAGLFRSATARAALDSHRGWDPGSVEIGEQLARELDAPLVVQRVSRLLVECNRSLGHPALFSEFSLGLSEAERAVVLERYWSHHRDAVRRHVDAAPPGLTVVHLGVHTFTSAWKGRRRPTDIGLLYDPRRRTEADLARRWRRELERLVGGEGWSGGVAVGGAVDASDGPERGSARPVALEGLRVHLNRPYRGWTDGLTTTLRREHYETRYLGIELEVSQRLVPLPADVVSRIGRALRSVVE